MKKANSRSKLALEAETIRMLTGRGLSHVVGGRIMQETKPPSGGTQDPDTSVMGCVPTSQSEQH